MRGSGRMSIAAKGALCLRRTSTTPAENPQRGISGVPFMNRATRLPSIIFLISSRIGSDMMPPSWLRRRGLQLQGVNDVLRHQLLERSVDHLVLLDERAAPELRRHHD